MTHYPKKTQQTEETYVQYKSPGCPGSQLVPLPQINPILEGVRWRQYHYAMSDTQKSVPEMSWECVLKEKAEDVMHALQFPYNGESPRSRLVDHEITRNEDFFVRNHGGVPETDPAAYSVDMEGLVKNPKTLEA